MIFSFNLLFFASALPMKPGVFSELSELPAMAKEITTGVKLEILPLNLNLPNTPHQVTTNMRAESVIPLKIPLPKAEAADDASGLISIGGKRPFEGINTEDIRDFMHDQMNAKKPRKLVIQVPKTAGASVVESKLAPVVEARLELDEMEKSQLRVKAWMDRNDFIEKNQLDEYINPDLYSKTRVNLEKVLPGKSKDQVEVQISLTEANKRIIDAQNPAFVKNGDEDLLASLKLLKKNTEGLAKVA